MRLLIAAAISAIAASAQAASITDQVTFNPVIISDDDFLFQEGDIRVDESGTISDVTVTVVFAGASDDISQSGVPSGSGDPFYDELELSLRSPAGTVVSLVTEFSYLFDEDAIPEPETSPTSGTFTVTFSDAAQDEVGSTNDGIPEDGTFQPFGLLSDFDGENTAGTWQILIRDAFEGQPKSVNAVTLNIETSDEITVVPLPGALPMMVGALALLGFAARRRG